MSAVRELIQEAIRLCGGSQRRLAVACGVTQPTISDALRLGMVTDNLALRIHRATGGRVPGSSLRPDLWLRPEHVPSIEGDAEHAVIAATKAPHEAAVVAAKDGDRVLAAGEVGRR